MQRRKKEGDRETERQRDRQRETDRQTEDREERERDESAVFDIVTIRHMWTPVVRWRLVVNDLSAQWFRSVSQQGIGLDHDTLSRENMRLCMLRNMARVKFGARACF